MEFRILGPLEVQDGDRRVAVGAGKQRALLALLLLHANEVLSADRLIDELWAESPPESARKAVQVYVSRLRKALGAERIRTSGAGYLVAVAADELDLHRFERLLEQGREARSAGNPGPASALLKEALALWHGSSLADLADEPFAQAEIARLEERRLSAREEWLEAELTLGRGPELVSELEALVATHPYRERLRGQLMLALYRAGRQADALALYQETRRRFVEELGIEPSPALQRLESAILRQEPELEALLEPVETTPEVEQVPPAEDPPQTWLSLSTGRLAGVAIAALVLVAVLVGIAVPRLQGPNYLSEVDEYALAVIDAEAPGVSAQITELGGRPDLIASGGGSIWAGSAADGTVSRIGLDLSGTQTATISGTVGGVAHGAGFVWVTSSDERALVQIDPGTLRIVQTFPVGNGPRGVAVGSDAAWVVNTIDETVSRIDLARGSVTDTIPIGPHPTGIAVGASGVWIASESTGRVVRIDPASRSIVADVNVGNSPSAIAVGEGGVWVANRQDNTVSRIDPATDSVTATVPVGRDPTSLAAGAETVWVANSGDGTITGLDPRTGRITETLGLGSSPITLALANGKLWATTAPPPARHRGGVLRIESDPSACRCADPAFFLEGGSATDGIIPQLAFDGLVAYRRAGGLAGATLIPSLAARLPTPTDRGKTYTFRLRRGLRYSDGSPVRASDFRSSLERTITINRGYPADIYRRIVGADCSPREGERCDLSAGIESDDEDGTIVIHLTEPDSEFLHKLALPFASLIPAETQLRPARAQSIPVIGPYRIASIAPDRELRLVRNEHFRVWSKDARPDGYPDEIRIHLSDNGEARLAAVEEGRADWVSLVDPSLTSERQRGALTRHADRLHSGPLPATFWLALNTRVPPLDDVRVRRALNYAIDRATMVERTGGLTQETCQMLPPSFPGYRPHCPYTREPNPAGTWTAPDLVRARALVAASATAGMRVEIATYTSAVTLPIARHVASVLRELGYQSSLRFFPVFGDQLAYAADSRNPAQIVISSWQAETPTASSFLRPLFACASFLPKSRANTNLSRYCDPALEARMNEAASLQAADPKRANELWSAVDKALVDRAVAVPWGSPRNRVLVSKRVGNYQSHPFSGTLLEQLWVR